MYPSKWINLKKFSVTQTKDSFFHSNILTFYKKPNKTEQWYLKRYRKLRAHYEIEAVASDLFRFILGKDRAAKSQVTYDDKGQVGIISQHNPAGYESALDIHVHTKESFDGSILSVEHGRCEVTIAEFILDEVDGLYNPCNVGLNKKNEVSRIDFDCSFFRGKNSWDALTIYCTNEKLVLDTKDINVINRFFKSMLQIVLLTDPKIISILNNRHNLYPEIKTYVRNKTIANCKIISQDILRSEHFKDFIQKYDSAEITNYCRDFFKHEEKNFPLPYRECMQAIEQILTHIKPSIPPNLKKI